MQKQGFPNNKSFRNLLIGLGVFAILFMIFSANREDIATMLLKKQATDELRKNLDDPTGMQVFDFLIINDYEGKEYKRIPKGLFFLIQPFLEDPGEEDTIVIFKMRYRAKNRYGALRRHTAYGFRVSFKGGGSIISVNNEDDLRI